MSCPKPAWLPRRTAPTANAATAAGGCQPAARAGAHAGPGRGEAEPGARRRAADYRGADRRDFVRDEPAGDRGLPQGSHGSINKVLLQAPGVTQDSAASGEIHVRNEHANLQYRINGITLPDGISGFGHVLDSKFIGNLALITGALPAQFGLRTSGVVDIQTKSGNAFNKAAASASMAAATAPHAELRIRRPRRQHGVFLHRPRFGSNLGIENPTASQTAIHDRTEQGNFFSYTLDDARSDTPGVDHHRQHHKHVPNSEQSGPDTPAPHRAFGVTNFNSAQLNERQNEHNPFDVLALQKSVDGFDGQIAAFTRYSTLHFLPDHVGDLVFNGIASDVYRQQLRQRIARRRVLPDQRCAYAARRLHGHGRKAHKISNVSTVLPLTISATRRCAVHRHRRQLEDRRLSGAYVQDEWRITNQLTLNTGLRFDQMWQYIDANQLSPRVNLIYKPFDGTTFHAGYARYFTPPQQALAAPVNLALFADTTAAADATHAKSGAAGTLALFRRRRGAEDRHKASSSASTPITRRRADLLDDGQFGAALSSPASTTIKGENKGVELSANYINGNFSAYGNVAVGAPDGQEHRLEPISVRRRTNSPTSPATTSTPTTPRWSPARPARPIFGRAHGSARAMIYGSGLRCGFANTDHVPPIRQVNLGVSHEISYADASRSRCASTS